MISILKSSKLLDKAPNISAEDLNLKDGDIITVTIKAENYSTGGSILHPGTYDGIFKADGGILHVCGGEVGEMYRVYRIPSVTVWVSGAHWSLTFLDDKSIPSMPRKLLSEKKLLGYVGSEPVYGGSDDEIIPRT